MTDVSMDNGIFTSPSKLKDRFIGELIGVLREHNLTADQHARLKAAYLATSAAWLQEGWLIEPCLPLENGGSWWFDGYIEQPNRKGN